MPLDAAERMRRYREKLKANPEKYEEHKRKHAKLVKERSKKIAELTDKEKEKLRKKWREQKQKQKKKKASECNPAESSKNTYKIKKGKIKARNRSRISRQYKAALKKIDTLTKALQTTRKQFYRYKVKSSKEIELLQQCVTKMKIRGEVLESSLKSTYEKCRTHEQKRLFKSLADNEKVTAAKMKTKFSKLLGLKGKIRKSKERVKNVKTRLEMEKFFTRDDVSRITAGKKECRTSKKKKEQIRYLIDTMYILYQKYKSEGGKYSFSTFYKYKPFFVLSPNVKNRDTCLCIKHSNIELQLCALQKVLITNHRSITDVLKQLCCDLNSYPCMYGTCQTCKKNKLDYQLKEGQINLNVEWFHWERIDHTYEKNENGTIKTVTTKKAAKVKKTGTIDTLIKNFENDIPAFKIHYFTWIHQQRQYQKCINELQENEALILCDFSENYLCKMANEIQSMHFGAAKAQITLHTGMIYWKDACQSFCTVADSNCHEPQAIWAHLLPIIKLTRETRPTTIIHFYSDGPSSQYRQKKNFFLHNHFTCELGLDYSTWSFSESGHGKGVADGIGGAVKRALDRQVAYGKDISDAREAYDVLKNCMKTVECLLIKNADIDIITKILPKNLKAVPGTMKIHQISSRFRDIIIYRTHSCFCSSERGMGDCYSPQKYVFGQPNRDERRSEIRDGIKKVARHKKENKTIDERNGIKKVARDKKENKTRYERDCIKKLVRDKKGNKTKDERDHGNEKFNERVCYLIADSDIEDMSALIPGNIRPVPGTMKLHQVIATEANQIKHRVLSCFCGEKRGLCNCHNPKMHALMPGLTSPVVPPDVPPIVPLPSDVFVANISENQLPPDSPQPTEFQIQSYQTPLNTRQINSPVLNVKTHDITSCIKSSTTTPLSGTPEDVNEEILKIDKPPLLSTSVNSDLFEIISPESHTATASSWLINSEIQMALPALSNVLTETLEDVNGSELIVDCSLKPRISDILTSCNKENVDINQSECDLPTSLNAAIVEIDTNSYNTDKIVNINKKPSTHTQLKDLDMIVIDLKLDEEETNSINAMYDLNDLDANYDVSAISGMDSIVDGNSKLFDISENTNHNKKIDSTRGVFTNETLPTPLVMSAKDEVNKFTETHRATDRNADSVNVIPVHDESANLKTNYKRVSTEAPSTAESAHKKVKIEIEDIKIIANKKTTIKNKTVKLSKPLKVVVKRTLPCNKCKKHHLFYSSMTKSCLKCKQVYCLKCISSSELENDNYVCEFCVEL